MNNSNNNPVVLGELKKEKSSKPILVLLVFILVLGVCFGLPYINTYLSTESNSFTNFVNKYLGKYVNNDNSSTPVNNSTTTTTTTTTTKKVDDGLKELSTNTVISLNNIYLENIVISNNNNLSYKISSRSTVNLDLEKYYLEIYDSNKSLLKTVKLTGYASTVSNVINKVVNINNSSKYYLKLTSLDETKLVDITLNNNVLTCKKDNNTYKYTFNEGLLKSINHELIYVYDSSDLNVLADSLTNSKAKSTFINNLENSSSGTEEIKNGYKFAANLDMSKFKVIDLKEYIDYNYYDLDTTAKYIKYDMVAKGFDCE